MELLPLRMGKGQLFFLCLPLCIFVALHRRLSGRPRLLLLLLRVVLLMKLMKLLRAMGTSRS